VHLTRDELAIDRERLFDLSPFQETGHRQGLRFA
jgi:hypothetical protein